MMDDEKICNMSFKTRLIVFLVLVGASCLISFMALIPFSRDEAPTFALLYVISTMCNVGLIFILKKPANELESLKDVRAHLVSFICLLISIALVLVVSFTAKNIWLTLVFLCIQYGCYFMYVYTGSFMFKATSWLNGFFKF